jgi:DNA-binding response OmpR family regulator
MQRPNSARGKVGMVAYQAPTLMVIGEDSSFRYLIQRYARKVACRVVFAHLADDVLDVVLQETPGIVMVELDAPGERGKEVVRALREHPKTCQIPLIVCSWTSEGEASLDTGTALYMQKPILYDDFQAMIVDVGRRAHV